MVRRFRLVRMIGLLTLLVSACSLSIISTGAVQGVTCADYSTTSAAQFALDINPNLANALDPDGNGRACDHESAMGLDRSANDLQIPAEPDETPTPVRSQPNATVDVIDQQPVDTAQQPTPVQGITLEPSQEPTPTPGNTTQQTGISVLDGRLGSTVTAFARVHDTPIDEQVSEANPAIVGRSYTAPQTATELFVIYFDDRAAIVLVTAEQPWTGTEAAAVIREFLPADVTQLPSSSETLADGSILIPIFSDDLATGVTADMMANANLPGVPGDMYMLLVTDGSNRATEIEIGIGNGYNVREDVNESTSADPAAVAGAQLNTVEVSVADPAQQPVSPGDQATSG